MYKQKVVTLTNITKKGNVQGTYTTREKNVQRTDITIESKLKGQTLQANP